METRVYAPVIIPTLSRYEHFKRCLESLERCTEAKNTNVYIGLDYPPSEKYAEGWKKIDAYLAKKEKSNGFMNLYVRRRKENCGVCKKGSNMNLLINEVRPIADYYITSEDDNEFSPNFLVYMNLLLNKFKDDERILSVCGYLFLNKKIPINNTCFLSSFANSWGCGRWSHKMPKYATQGKLNYLNSVLFSWRTSFKLFRKRSASLNGFITMFFKNEYYGDIFRTAEMLLEDEYSIFPVVSKVRNWGVDGSGLHSGKEKSNTFALQEIDQNSQFELWNSPLDIIQLKGRLDYKIMKKVYVLIRYIIFRALRKDLNKLFLIKIKPC